MHDVQENLTIDTSAGSKGGTADTADWSDASASEGTDDDYV